MFVTQMIEQKRRYRRYKARKECLSAKYRTAVDAIERYLMHFVPADGDSAAAEFEDLADLFEQAAAGGTSIREIVGDDPVEFVEAFAQNYTKGGYVPDRARERLIGAIERAEAEDGPAGSGC